MLSEGCRYLVTMSASILASDEEHKKRGRNNLPRFLCLAKAFAYSNTNLSV